MKCEICGKKGIRTEVGLCSCGSPVTCRMCKDCVLIKIDRYVCSRHRGIYRHKNFISISHGTFHYQLYCISGSTKELLTAMFITSILEGCSDEDVEYTVDYYDVSKEVFYESLYRLQ